MRMNVTALISWESEPRMLIEYKLRKDMATVVEHLVMEISEVVVVVVCLEEDMDKLFVIIVINQDM
jgi:hypothetical protein